MNSARVPVVSPLPKPAKNSATPSASAHAATTMTRTNAVGAGQARGEHPGRQVDQPEQQMTQDRAGGPAAEGPHALQSRVHERVDREEMTSARIVTSGQAMAKIPTMTARMPSRTNEVDDDLNMTGIPSACLSRTTFIRELRGACHVQQTRRPAIPANSYRL
jgi:hypothetical protein